MMYQAKNPESFLPGWLKGRGIQLETVRLKCRDGSTIEVPADQPFETEDERCIRHLDVDPRFIKLGV